MIKNKTTVVLLAVVCHLGIDGPAWFGGDVIMGRETDCEQQTPMISF